ncbi:unnamed protein product [Cercospora beticola]|nr:unnamed protein product [Cercospora beticola]
MAVIKVSAVERGTTLASLSIHLSSSPHCTLRPTILPTRRTFAASGSIVSLTVQWSHITVRIDRRPAVGGPSVQPTRSSSEGAGRQRCQLNITARRCMCTPFISDSLQHHAAMLTRSPACGPA